MRGLCGLLACGGLLFALAAQAETSDAPCPKPGTLLKFSDGTVLEAIADIGDGWCRLRNQRTATTFERMLGAILATSQIMKPHVAELRSLLPLAVGKKVTFQYSAEDDRGANGTWTISVAVERQETATTPAGTWACFVILQTDQLFSGTGKWERRWWYCPDVGYVVQYEFRTVQGILPKNTPAKWYLVEIVRK